MRAVRAEMPHPSSTTVDEGLRIECVQRGLDSWSESHSAKRGVIFHRTRLFVSGRVK